MYSLLLAIIYVAFISLGLPDSLLGSGWPVMYGDLGVSVSFAGVVSMIIAGGTIVSSLLSDRLTRRFSAGLVTAVSVGMTAIAILGFSLSNSAVVICLFAIPYGLGAGAVDAALNNYVALHYSSRHMSWLHCFWGVGTSISPYIMSYCLTGGFGWREGYRTVAIFQIVLTAILFASLPLWKKRTNSICENKNDKPLGIIGALKIKGVKFALISFFGYCALESTTGLWASSYLVLHRNIDKETAALFSSLFYMGITAGRFFCGLIADKFGDRALVRAGVYVGIVGIFAVWLPLSTSIVSLAGLVMIGLGCAPIYPSIIHQTPKNFGESNSQAIIGIQMASAYFGSTFMPPIFGLVASKINIGLFPYFLLIFGILMAVMTEMLNKSCPVKE